MPVFSGKVFHLVQGPTHICDKGGLTDARVKALQRVIQAHDGRCAGSLAEADVWLVNDAVLPTYRRYCLADPAHRAEGGGFVKRCVDAKRFLDAYVEDAMPMPGRVPGKRNDFTEAEKELLCQWIAMKIPEKAAGGRYGQNIYKQLVVQAMDFPNGLWGAAVSHPWASWLEHYKKNAETLDPRIAEIVEEKGYTSDQKTTYRVDRRVNGLKRIAVREESEESEDGNEGEGAAIEQEQPDDEESEEEPLRKRQRRVNQRSSSAAYAMNAEAGPSGANRQATRSPVVDRPPSPLNTQKTMVDPSQPPGQASSSRQRTAQREPVAISESEGEQDNPAGNQARGGRHSGSSVGTVRATPFNTRRSESSRSPSAPAAGPSRHADRQPLEASEQVASANAIEGVLDGDEQTQAGEFPSDDSQDRSREFGSDDSRSREGSLSFERSPGPSGSEDEQEPLESDASDDARAAEGLL
ncbi:hypothetical protein PHLGIDRAFT_189221 [Phlebiopsis gigantea 11061_1 CR5-6]|uniref:DNA-binding protein RAP1 n=1 Tax=Phlebiopsis gigantea (strain 11061_1 CR5-6) TaxID=745531 RepID=A0A0C3S794_PHLG1|nr:hypothetical protein PHLGIDRAFT_189221 [Phlebiopsis gigantea 11061_1 CR5-6]